MNSENKEITIKNIDHSGMPDMIGRIFRYIIEAHRDILYSQEATRRQGWEIFEKFKKEYKRAQRPLVFFGSITSKNVMMKANRYGLSQMMRFFRAFHELENNLISNVIRMVNESPSEFFSAIKAVWSEGNGQTMMPEPNASYIKLLNEMSNSLKFQEGIGKNDEREFAKAKRKNFKKNPEY
jgi:hypothetical protein